MGDPNEIARSEYASFFGAQLEESVNGSLWMANSYRVSKCI
jgi:hypothetical protein